MDEMNEGGAGGDDRGMERGKKEGTRGRVERGGEVAGSKKNLARLI